MRGDTKLIREIVENVLLVITAVVSIAIAVLDLTGMLDASSWVAQRIPALTLLGVGFVASYLIIERRGKLDDLTSSVDRHSQDILESVESAFKNTVSALKGVDVKTFSDGASFIDYFVTRAQSSKRVDDTTWGVDLPITSAGDVAAYNRYQDSVDEIATRADVIWREISIFAHQDRFMRIKQRIKADLYGYSVVYYETPSKDAPPRLSFAILDNEEVFLAGQDLRLAVRHPEIVRYFAQYYEIAWRKGKPLKTGRLVDQTHIQDLEATIVSSFKKSGDI